MNVDNKMTIQEVMNMKIDEIMANPSKSIIIEDAIKKSISLPEIIKGMVVWDSMVQSMKECF